MAGEWPWGYFAISKIFVVKHLVRGSLHGLLETIRYFSLIEVIVTRCACLVFTLILAAVPAMANIPSPELCVLDMPGTYAAVLFTLPNGSGNAFTDARLNGDTVDATLILTVVNNLGDPIENYPAEDIWLVTEGGFTSCDMANPDSNTNADGQTRWVEPLFGGGNSLGWGVQAVIAGDIVLVAAALQFVSADMNGDLEVNLSDISLISQGLAVNDINADLNADGIVNLSDIALMTEGIGQICP